MSARPITPTQIPGKEHQSSVQSLMDADPWSNVQIDYSYSYTKLANQPRPDVVEPARESNPRTRQGATNPDATTLNSESISTTSRITTEQGELILWPALIAFLRDALWYVVYESLDILRWVIIVFPVTFGLFVAAATILGFLAFVVFPQIDFTHVDVRYMVDGVSHTIDLATVQEVQLELSEFGIEIGLDFNRGRELAAVQPTVTVKSPEMKSPEVMGWLDLAVPPQAASPGFSSKIETLKFW